MSNFNLKWDEKGLIPAIVQDVNTKEVLMMAYMNEDSLKKTLETGRTCFWSRSRQKFWFKGESSGNIQKVKEVRYDCDADSLLILVEQIGAACHEGYPTCYFRTIDGAVKSEKSFEGGLYILDELYKLIETRKKELPNDSYTTKLLLDKNLLLKKIGEEASEVIISFSQEKDRTVEETSDLIYHLFVLLVERDIKLQTLLEELKKRRK
ncbi:MAG: Phosphoribosyl-AMP cyclohydrolase [Candidatus Methanofastidiosum methylothiophilum]|uniref:Histidine biosynthesis bifunctional protein HisIE n=1 Tax=Candidatus Methanofastidiosum methylothiophilum TaxID=1705564 RepID=A0A150JAL9_9EURY|nr:MAG: Phosphoribosyl-AMP cyclohydrolase [Candidatus Methanofastidiosum methylthiophilus]NMC76071.1 bifunctional phosphoribosyl-AMP cyclohydrolase/phosphoribosyl-ATP diphosphatase HisIE [Candidatus Methanofastidiosa archaeon]